MKTPLSIAAVALLGLAVVSPLSVRADSDDVKTTTTTTSNTVSSQGTISEFSPDSFMIRSSASSAPVRYSYTKTTTYVDEAGNPVSMEMVKSGAPVTVFYDRNGDQMIASKVIVRQAPVSTQRTTTTTTTKKDDE